MGLIFAGGLLQAVDDIIQVGRFLLAQAAVSGIAGGGGDMAAVREAEQAVQGAALVVAAGTCGAGRAAVVSVVGPALPLGGSSPTAAPRVLRAGAALHRAVRLRTVAAVALAGLARPGGRRAALAGRRLDLLDEQLPSDTRPAGGKKWAPLTTSLVTWGYSRFTIDRK